MTWRDRLYLLALYPLEEVPKLLYKLCFFIFLLFVMIGGALFHAYAEEQAASHNESHNTGHTTFLSPKLETAIFQSPRLRQSGARACRAIFVLGQRRADNRVSISASLSGERQLAHNFRTNNDDLSDTSHRAYDRQNDDLLDLELQARYRIMDWGVGSARVRAEEYQLAAERLSYEAGLSETLQDILRLMMQIEGARIDVQYRTNALQEMQPHIEAIEAQGIAGSVGIAEVRAVKLTVLNAEIALQRAERHLSESLNQLQASYQISYEDGLPLLDRFTDLRGDAFIEIEPEDWRNIRILDYRFKAQTEELYAIEHENLPQFDTVLETSIFDVTDYESEYQIVGRLEMSVPLYDGGANHSRSQEKSWQLREIASQRDELIRNHRRDSVQSQLIVTRRFTEMETIGSQLQDIQSRYDSLLALLGNSRVSRRDIIELIQTRAEKTIELETLQWQQEFAYVQINWLADNLTPLLGITLGDSQC